MDPTTQHNRAATESPAAATAETAGRFVFDTSNWATTAADPSPAATTTPSWLVLQQQQDPSIHQTYSPGVFGGQAHPMHHHQHHHQLLQQQQQPQPMSLPHQHQPHEYAMSGHSFPTNMSLTSDPSTSAAGSFASQRQRGASGRSSVPSAMQSAMPSPGGRPTAARHRAGSNPHVMYADPHQPHTVTGGGDPPANNMTATPTPTPSPLGATGSPTQPSLAPPAIPIQRHQRSGLTAAAQDGPTPTPGGGGITGGARDGEVQVYAPGFDRVLNLPRAAIKHLPPPNLNVTRLVLCANYDAKSSTPELTCPMRDRCKFVHADAGAARDHPIHVNYAWRSFAEVVYERFPPGDPLHVAPPNSKVATETYEPHTLLKTRALASSRRPLSHCAHYHFNRTCNLGHECRFVHAVYIDPDAKDHQRAPIATIRHQLQRSGGGGVEQQQGASRPPQHQRVNSHSQQSPPQHHQHHSLQPDTPSPAVSPSVTPHTWQSAASPTDGSSGGASRRASGVSISVSPRGPRDVALLTRQLHEQQQQIQQQQQQYNTLVQAIAAMKSTSSSPSSPPPGQHDQPHHHHQYHHQPQQQQQQTFVQIMTPNGPVLVPANTVVLPQQQQQQFAVLAHPSSASPAESFGGGTFVPVMQQQQQQHHHQQQQQQYFAHHHRHAFAPPSEAGSANPSPTMGGSSPPNASRRASLAISLPPGSPRRQSMSEHPQLYTM